jgi:hypothetical protein
MSELKKNRFINIIHSGLKKINEKFEIIDIKKTNKSFIGNQLNPQMLKEFDKITDDNYDSFYQIIENKSFLNKIKVHTLDNKSKTLNTVLRAKNNKLSEEYAENKMFYLYFNIVLVEKFLESYNKKLRRPHIKKRLESILISSCSKQKTAFKKCLGKYKNHIEVIPMNNMENSIKNKCNKENNDLNNCLSFPTHLTLQSNSGLNNDLKRII